MPTIIDSLIVRLGLDSKPLNQQAAPAGQKLEAIEKQGNRATQSVSNLGKGLASLLALLGGVTAVRRFVEDFIDANAALDRFSKNIGLSVSTISAWGNAVEGVGGNVKSAQSTLDMFSRAQTELRLTGESSLIPYLSALGVSLADVGGNARPVDQILLDLAGAFERIGDRTTANNMGRMLGIDQDTMSLLLKGRREVEATIAKQKEYAAVTKQQAAEASRLQRTIVGLKQQFSAFGRELVMAAAPALERVLQYLTGLGQWVQANGEFVRGFLGLLAAGFTAIAVAALPLTGTAALVAGLAAAIVLLWQDYQTWKRGGDTLIDWEKWKPGIDAAVAGIEFLAHKAAAAFGVIKTGASIAKAAINGNWAVVDSKTNDMSNQVRQMVGLKPIDHGSPKPNPPQTGTAEYMMKYFQDRGHTREQAAGIVANIISESGGRTNAIGDGGSAYGLAQWHKNRQADFAAFAGHDIRMSTLDEQLAFVQHELTKGNEKNAGRALDKSKTAYQAGSVITHLFERPADVTGEASRRGHLADLLARNGGSSTSTTDDHSVSVHVGEVKVMTQATDANGVARGIADSMGTMLVAQAATGMP